MFPLHSYPLGCRSRGAFFSRCLVGSTHERATDPNARGERHVGTPAPRRAYWDSWCRGCRGACRAPRRPANALSGEICARRGLNRGPACCTAITRYSTRPFDVQKASDLLAFRRPISGGLFRTPGRKVASPPRTAPPLQWPRFPPAEGLYVAGSGIIRASRAASSRQRRVHRVRYACVAALARRPH